MSESDSSDDNFITQRSFSGTIQSSREDESLLDVPADHFDGLDVKETLTELFEEVTRSESSNEVGEASKKVGVSRRVLK